MTIILPTDELCAAIREFVTEFEDRLSSQTMDRLRSALENPVSCDEAAGNIADCLTSVFTMLFSPTSFKSSIGLQWRNGIVENVDIAILQPHGSTDEGVALCYTPRSYSSPFQIARSIYFVIDTLFVDTENQEKVALIIEMKEVALARATECLSAEAKANYAHADWDFLFAMLRNLKIWTDHRRGPIQAVDKEKYVKRAAFLGILADCQFRRLSQKKARHDSLELLFKNLFKYIFQGDAEEAWVMHIVPIISHLQLDEKQVLLTLTALQVDIETCQSFEDVVDMIISHMGSLNPL